MAKRAHTNSFRVKATGYETASGKKRIPLTLDADLLTQINDIAETENTSISSTIANILDRYVQSSATNTLALTSEERQLIRSHRAIFGRAALEGREESPENGGAIR